MCANKLESALYCDLGVWGALVPLRGRESKMCKFRVGCDGSFPGNALSGPVQRPRKLTMEEKMMWHPSAYVMEYYRYCAAVLPVLYGLPYCA